MHEKFPPETLPQWVLPQRRPCHDNGALMILDSPVCKAKPVVEKVPESEAMAGQTVNSHWFSTVSVVAE
ncbi:UNVERIFIED_CONTAM: hypothetical protein Slati_4339700 [Sesamum latifolium]|uniref:Uncharacterized protein n=1 Tax=Sesamum latifolium TaxID=2727402 RepID=A0AAW2SNT1_9LAMI